jgi:hypothetical protein
MKAYAVKFMDYTGDNINSKNISNTLVAYLKEVVENKYLNGSKIRLSPQDYHYYSTIDLEKDDIVLVSNGETICVCLVINEVKENIKATRTIIAKIEFGDELKETKKAARKTRLLKAMEKRLKDVVNNEYVLKTAHMYQDDKVIEEYLKEYTDLITKG